MYNCEGYYNVHSSRLTIIELCSKVFAPTVLYKISTQFWSKYIWENTQHITPQNDVPNILNR